MRLYAFLLGRNLRPLASPNLCAPLTTVALQRAPLFEEVADCYLKLPAQMESPCAESSTHICQSGSFVVFGPPQTNGDNPIEHSQDEDQYGQSCHSKGQVVHNGNVIAGARKVV